MIIISLQFFSGKRYHSRLIFRENFHFLTDGIYVTPEASACELGHFINLDEGAAAWAEKIIPIVEKNIPVRRSHAKEVADAGFDSKTEAEKMLQYYLKALKG